MQFQHKTGPFSRIRFSRTIMRPVLGGILTGVFCVVTLVTAYVSIASARVEINWEALNAVPETPVHISSAPPPLAPTGTKPVAKGKLETSTGPAPKKPQHVHLTAPTTQYPVKPPPADTTKTASPPADGPIPRKVAALPPATRSVEAGMVVPFDPASASLLNTARDTLSKAARKLVKNAHRIQLRAYGGEAGDTSSAARRLSLKRALVVRSYLIEQGVLANRIDVRALGGVRDDGLKDRVDIVTSSR